MANAIKDEGCQNLPDGQLARDLWSAEAAESSETLPEAVEEPRTLTGDLTLW